MEPNRRNKAKRIFMTYMVVMQMIFTVIGLSLLGYYIGTRTDPDGDTYIYYTAIGLALGVMIGFMTVYQFMKSEERNERRSRH
ncbi:MAG: AtpZ/AtpI family protein [Acholeplasmataceae bacterium]|nr:AtpZ/AtpI family protein [Acholeplasmataceae bacterium]